MRRALPIAVLVILALAAWFVVDRVSGRNSVPASIGTERSGTSREVRPTGVLAGEQAASERRTKAAVSSAPASTPAATAGTGLTVRSSMDFELPFIEWETRQSDWQRIDLDHGHCELGPMTLPCRVRAPGHAAGLAQNDGDVIVLEPDALLVLEAHGLRACTASIGPSDNFIQAHEDETQLRPELRRAIAWRWLSDDRWAVCVTSELAQEAHGGDPITVAIHWRDERRAEVEFNASPGARATWTVPCEQLVSGGPLDVSIVSPPGEGVGIRTVHVWRIRGAPEGGRAETQSWGVIQFQPPNDFWLDRTVPYFQGPVHFDFVPTGVRLSLSARDTATSAYGRIVFVHDGSPRTLELRPAFELIARIVSDDGGSVVATANLSCEFFDGSERVWGWQAWQHHAEPAGDGAFHLRGPVNPPQREEVPLDPPSTLKLSVAAPGFEPFEQRYDTAGAVRFDCGEVRLKPLAPLLVLAPGHDLVPKSIEWMSLRASSRPDTGWNIRNGALASDGSMSIYLVESESSTKDTRRFDAWSVAKPLQLPWPTDPSRWLVIHVSLGDRDEEWLFERQNDGRYGAVPRREREVVVELGALPAEGKGWTVGWTWQDQWGCLSGIAPRRVGESIRMRIATPAEGASFWWSSTGTPPGILGAPKDVGGSVPLDASSGRIVLR
jgi:hypothetical protein